MLDWFFPLAGLGVIFGTLAFAWKKGGPAERLGAFLVLLGFIYAFGVHFMLKADARPIPLLVGEGLLSIGFLAIVLRYFSVWIGGAMILQAVQFSLHAFYLVGQKPHDPTYILINNLDTFGILACILFGTAMTWRARRSARSA